MQNKECVHDVTICIKILMCNEITFIEIYYSIQSQYTCQNQ